MVKYLKLIFSFRSSTFNFMTTTEEILFIVQVHLDLMREILLKNLPSSFTSSAFEHTSNDESSINYGPKYIIIEPKSNFMKVSKSQTR